MYHQTEFQSKRPSSLRDIAIIVNLNIELLWPWLWGQGHETLPKYPTDQDTSSHQISTQETAYFRRYNINRKFDLRPSCDLKFNVMVMKNIT